MTPTDRMPPIAFAEMTARQRAAVADFKLTRNTSEFDGPFIPLLRSPELLGRVHVVGQYLRFRSALPRRLSELAILITARHWGQQFEWDVHSTDATAVGVSSTIIDAVAEGRRPPGMAEDEAALHDFCQELLHNRRVSDPTYARGVELFGEQGVIDTVGLLGYYSLLGMVLNTARTPLREGRREKLERFPG